MNLNFGIERRKENFEEKKKKQQEREILRCTIKRWGGVKWTFFISHDILCVKHLDRNPGAVAGLIYNSLFSFFLLFFSFSFSFIFLFFFFFLRINVATFKSLGYFSFTQ